MPGTASAYQEIYAQYARAHARRRWLRCVFHIWSFGVVFCSALRLLLLSTKAYKKTKLLYTMVCLNAVRMSTPRTASMAVGARRAAWGRHIGSVIEYSCRCQNFYYPRPARRCRYVRSCGSGLGRRTRVHVRSSLCVVLPAGGWRAGVVSSRVILLLRGPRIRGPTGPANLCTGGRLPSNGEIFMRARGGAAGGHVARTRCAQLHVSTD